eukprot:g1558.t1
MSGYNWPLKDMFTGMDLKKNWNQATLSYYQKHIKKPSFKPILHVCLVVGVSGYMLKHMGHFKPHGRKRLYH